jgi:hypothetical protein
MAMFKEKGWLTEPPHVDHVLNETGLKHVPGLRIVSWCPLDGMPIYQCWINEGRATRTECPYCLYDRKAKQTNKGD